MNRNIIDCQVKKITASSNGVFIKDTIEDMKCLARNDFKSICNLVCSDNVFIIGEHKPPTSIKHVSNREYRRSTIWLPEIYIMAILCRNYPGDTDTIFNSCSRCYWINNHIQCLYSQDCDLQKIITTIQTHVRTMSSILPQIVICPDKYQQFNKIQTRSRSNSEGNKQPDQEKIRKHFTKFNEKYSLMCPTTPKEQLR